MKYELKYNPYPLSAAIELPASKSISNRALVLKALSQHPCTIHNLSDCDDTRIMMQALESKDTTIHIEGAGTAMRFLTAYYSISPGHHLLTGNDRMLQRPIQDLVDTLRNLGADISYCGKEGYPPLRIQGKSLKGNRIISIPLDKSSQFASAVAMIGCRLKGGLRILPDSPTIISRPYLDMTLHMMQEFGIDARWEDGTIVVPEQSPSLVSYTVENDWSAASYWYEILAILGRKYPNKLQVQLPHLYPDSIQGDARISTLFAKLGVQTHFTPEGVTLETDDVESALLREEVSDIPDLVPTIVVTCCMLDIPFVLKGVQSLHLKECDRVEALISELKKMGFTLRNSTDKQGESLTWLGEKENTITCPLLNTYNDHRMAMTLSGVCICYPKVAVDNPLVVSKSYPSYWDQLKKLGFTIEKHD